LLRIPLILTKTNIIAGIFVITDYMTQHIPLQTFATRKLFFFFTMFIIAICLYSLMVQPLIAQHIDKATQQSSYLQELPIINTDKSNMLILFANLINDKISNTIDVLEISSRDKSLKDVPFLKNVSNDFNGISPSLELDKRNLAKDILQRNKDIASIFFVLPNGDIYMGEPYSHQEQLPRINFADREWYKGVVKSNQTYISSIFLSASINSPAIAIAVPVYSLISDLGNQTSLSSLSGYWVGIINLRSIQDVFENQSLITEDQFILIDHNGTELLNTKTSNSESVNSDRLDNKSTSRPINNMTDQVKLDIFEHFNIIQEAVDDTKSVYNKVNLDDGMVMFWKPTKIKESNWYVVLITRI